MEMLCKFDAREGRRKKIREPAFLQNGLFILLRSEGERERKMRGNPLFAKSWIPTHPFRQKLPNMILQLCAGVKLVIVSRRLRNHLGVFGKGVQGENPFAKGFFSWRSAF